MKDRPLYLQIANELEKIIQIQNLKPHDPFPSEAELAGQFNVSRMTAKQALNKLASKGLVYRMERKGTFISGATSESELADRNKDIKKNLGLRKMFIDTRKQTNPHIVLIIPQLNQVSPKIIAALDAEARKRRFKLLIKLSKNVVDEESCLKQAYEGGAHGSLLFPCDRHSFGIYSQNFQLQGYPIILLDCFIEEGSIDCVQYNHYQGVYDMVKRMIMTGHREIGYVTRSLHGSGSSEEKYRGYLMALLDHGITDKSQYIHYIEQSKDDAKCYLSLDQFLQINRNMTAVMCEDDDLAAMLFRAAFHSKRSIPDQLSLAGYSDAAIAAMLPVPLTTVGQPAEELAELAIERLLRPTSEEGEAARTYKINTYLVERQTLAAPPGS